MEARLSQQLSPVLLPWSLRRWLPVLWVWPTLAALLLFCTLRLLSRWVAVVCHNYSGYSAVDWSLLWAVWNYELEMRSKSLAASALYFLTNAGSYLVVIQILGIRERFWFIPGQFSWNRLSVWVKVTVFNYIDDLLLASEDEKDLEALFQRLDEYGLKLSLHKCTFFAKEIVFLGHKVGQNGYSAFDSKVKAILEIPLPKTLQQLKRALRIINFYHRFLHRGAEILSSLHKILRGYKNSMKAKVIDWKKHPEAKEAFSKAKAELARKTLLH